MGRAAEDLDRQHRIHSPHALFQITNMLIFRFADAPECGAETYAHPTLLFARIVDPGVIEGELRRGYGKLRITIEALQPSWRKMFLRIPTANLAGASNLERPGVEA